MGIMMEQKEIFDQIYGERNKQFSPSPSLVDFYQNYIKRHVETGLDNKIKILEIGSGLGSLFQSEGLIESKNIKLSVTAIDFSFNAIREAKKRWKKFLDRNRSISEKLEITFLMRNILDDLNLNESFDLVIDSHCFHCLNGISEQKVGLKNMISNLKSGGILAIETMAYHKNISFIPPYYFDRGSLKIMKEDMWGTLVHCRTIAEPLEIEREILMRNMKIEYFTILPTLRVIPENKREVARGEDPQCLRIICRKT